MSQSNMMNQNNMPNGMPPHMNGIDSSHSSRDSSPTVRYPYMTQGPMAPHRPIPANQLPPTSKTINQLSQNYSNLQINNQLTPRTSPKMFSTSTPNEQVKDNQSQPAIDRNKSQQSQGGVLSPIGFNHSATSHFSNVALNGNSVSNLGQTSQRFNVPSNFGGTQLPHQNSLPSNAVAPPPRPPLQQTLSQPRLMAYNNGPVPTSTSSPQHAVPQNHMTQRPLMNQPNRMPNFNLQPSVPVQSPATRMPTQMRMPNSMQQYPNMHQQQHHQQQQQRYPTPQQYTNQLQASDQLPNVTSNSVHQNSTPAQDIPIRANLHSNRYPTQPQYNQSHQQQQYTQQTIPLQQQQQQKLQQNFYQQSSQNVVQSGFNKLWGVENFDLLQTPNILPKTKVEVPRITLGNELLDHANCKPDIFRCTMTKIPENNSLLQKSRLPLGVLIHPFKDLNHLPVIQCNTIVRCRSCRTYINPYVYFIDSKKWKCNLCYRINELPEEFQYDPVTKTYGDPSRRPEVKTSTIEYIAPSEYMLRPPQAAIYLFLLDISRAAIESGYLHTVCSVLQSELNNLPGDTRTQVGFIAYDTALHFFSFADGLSQPHEMTVLDIDDVFLPCPDNLLVNLQDCMELVTDLLAQLPNRYNNSFETGSALGAALQASYKMMASTGGRVTVFQATLPTIGPGALISREDPSQRAGSDVQHLNPANDFYKRLALECSGQQIAVDIFFANSQYVDIATISGICKFSGGCMYHFPLFKASRQSQNESFEKCLRRYLTRKIGFEAVMRIRCSRGLTIHTFHGNFFVRSTDLLSLPNINPDAGFGMQVSIEESLSDVKSICFQAALLYTSSKGERRIRVHTMCLPVVNNLTEIINSADQQCIIGLLSKMAVDRSVQSNLSDAREAFINVAIDILTSYKASQNMGATSGLMVPNCLRLLPLYISALLKSIAFRSGVSTRLDDRVKAMCDMKTSPLPNLIQQIYPDLYPVHNLHDQNVIENEDKELVPMPPILQLSARNIDSNGAYLMDMGTHMVIIVCSAVSSMFLNHVLGVSDYNSISDEMYELPSLDNEHNQRLHLLINYLNDEKPMNATLQIMRDSSPNRNMFFEKLLEDRIETALSYHEFLQHLKTQVK
ncbi:PREDICTED: protein transport protein Sec24A [Nicrophorus vespilloides]|uniref:Protein transport protein Sec24A n=1 Tax=Nicrophorus vespilloides TaxID=110193 RepID=A0ABM1MVI3_NICVS|nr:PREDICTED: protein transport protein Sec24A [Nicrophorus vespilloides]XP_017778584.1 PREDICTED: protein transport protein Sec24A [Nicrophorus vespilloides]